MAKSAAAEKSEAAEPLGLTASDAGLPAELKGYSGYEDFDPSDLIIPRVKIIQPTSRKGTPGMFLMNLTEEEFRELSVIVIKANRSRILWSQDLDSEEPLCKSNDFLTPDRSIENPVSPVCAEYVQKGDLKVLETVCSKAKWISNERPECNQVFNLLCLSSEDVPFWISLSGSSIAPVKRLISAIALRRKKLWQFETLMTTEERIKPNRHYTVHFGAPKALDDERLASIGDLVLSLKDQAAQFTQDFDAAPMDAESVPF